MIHDPQFWFALSDRLSQMSKDLLADMTSPEAECPMGQVSLGVIAAAQVISTAIGATIHAQQQGSTNTH